MDSLWRNEISRGNFSCKENEVLYEENTSMPAEFSDQIKPPVQIQTYWIYADFYWYQT